MNVLLVYREEEKEKYQRQIASIISYWKKAGFCLETMIRTEENDKTTCLEVQKKKFDYLIVLNTVGFSGTTTGGLLNYTVMGAIQIFLILDSLLFEKYEDRVFSLNQYYVISKSYSYYCRADFLNKVLCEDNQVNFDNIFDFIRKDCLEKETLLCNEFREGGKYLDNLEKKGEYFDKQYHEIEQCFQKFNHSNQITDLNDILSKMEYIDDFLALYNLGEIAALKKCLEILQLDLKANYVLFSEGCTSIKEMNKKYYRLVDAMRDIQFLKDTDLVNARLGWMVNLKISPFAIIVVLKNESVGSIDDNYRRYISFFECIGDYKSAQILDVFSKRERN